MADLGKAIKVEISRLARKEIKSEVASFKQASSNYRRELAAVRKTIQDLTRLVEKTMKAPARQERGERDEPSSEWRFRQSGFVTLRKRLGLSGQEMGKLLGVSPQSVYHWESGKSKPRAAQLERIAEVRALGKKEVQARLASMDKV